MHSEQIDVNTNITCTDDYSEIEWKLELKKLKIKAVLWSAILSMEWYGK